MCPRGGDGVGNPWPFGAWWSDVTAILSLDTVVCCRVLVGNDTTRVSEQDQGPSLLTLASDQCSEVWACVTQTLVSGQLPTYQVGHGWVCPAVRVVLG